MGNNKGTDRAKMAAAVDDRRARVASFKVRGLSIRQTAVALEKVGVVNPKTGKGWSALVIHQDLQFLQERWRTEALGDITEAKTRELAKLDEVEAQAWEAWHRSIGKTKKTLTERRTGGRTPGEKAAVSTEELNGDPRYLTIVLDCQARRAKMLGLDMPTKIAPTTPDGDRPFHGVMLIPAPISPEGWEAMAQRTQAELKVERG